MTLKKQLTKRTSSVALAALITVMGVGTVVGSAVDNYVSPKQAAKAEQKAIKALAKHKYNQAIIYGETAVSGAPHEAAYRMLLGQANLSAGKFASAETLFADVLTLDPSNGRAALNLALSQIALDRASEAHATLEAHHDQIAPADYGLALALAGDTVGGVQSLEGATRGPNSTAKTRQNLALAYALSGRWSEARVEASQDLAPDMVDKRMTDWAQMAHPKASWDQVATLLHVSPSNDTGLPYRLALARTPNSVAVTAPVIVAAAAAPISAPEASPDLKTPRARYETNVVNSSVISAAAGATQFSPAAESVEAVAPIIHAERTPTKQLMAARARSAKKPVASDTKVATSVSSNRKAMNGHFAAQIGAYPNAAIAQASWKHTLKTASFLQQYQPSASQFTLQAQSYYRLSVMGFVTHNDAAIFCEKLQSTGNKCFVRAVMGDQLADWSRATMAHRLAIKSPAKPLKMAVAANQKPNAKLAAIQKSAPQLIKLVPKTVVTKVAAKPAQHTQIIAAK